MRHLPAWLPRCRRPVRRWGRGRGIEPGGGREGVQGAAQGARRGAGPGDERRQQAAPAPGPPSAPSLTAAQPWRARVWPWAGSACRSAWERRAPSACATAAVSSRAPSSRLRPMHRLSPRRLGIVAAETALPLGLSLWAWPAHAGRAPGGGGAAGGHWRQTLRRQRSTRSGGLAPAEASTGAAPLFVRCRLWVSPVVGRWLGLRLPGGPHWCCWSCWRGLWWREGPRGGPHQQTPRPLPIQRHRPCPRILPLPPPPASAWAPSPASAAAARGARRGGAGRPQLQPPPCR